MKKLLIPALLLLVSCTKRDIGYECRCDVYGKGTWVAGEFEQYTKVTEKEATVKCDKFTAGYQDKHKPTADTMTDCNLKEFDIK